MAWSKKGKVTHLWVTHVTDKGLVHHCLTWRKTWRKVICFQHKLEIPCHVQCDDPSVESSIKKCVRHLQISLCVFSLEMQTNEWRITYEVGAQPNDVPMMLESGSPKPKAKMSNCPKPTGERQILSVKYSSRLMNYLIAAPILVK